jgi:hypothetical protein
MPSWSELDRFGIVVAEPLGALGASLLLQLAIAQFYDVRPERRDAMPVYPEIYLLHVGQPHGDFSSFDFWPPRKEIVVPAGDPLALLEKINEVGVSRLAVPEGPAGALDEFDHGPSSWAERAAATERLRTCVLYSPGGRVKGGDLTLGSDDSRTRENAADVLEPVENALRLRDDILAGRDVFLPGPSTTHDILQWVERVQHRSGEVGSVDRSHAAASIGSRWGSPGGTTVETYQRTTASDALMRLAGIFSN